ncbi:MAG: hypothetical protein LBD94_03095 [Rickettsiales bacterium]|jgi:gas vesicle protein|nr:hypothetical protein [Rickettsiales bacterium]
MFAAVSVSQIILVSAAGLLVAMLPFLFFQSRRAERIMRSLQALLFEPSRAKVADAQKIIGQILDDAVAKIASNFNSMAAVLSQQAARAEMLEKKLGVQNKLLVSTADAAAERVSGMTRTLENLISNLSNIVGGKEWTRVRDSAESFNLGAGALVKELESKSREILNLSSELNSNIANWSESGRKMADELQQNIADSTDQINMMSISAKGMNAELSQLQSSVASDFENVKLSSQGIENVLSNSGKLLGQQLEKMENFTEQARKLLQSQVNTMSDTAARIGTDIRLAESSIETGTDKLNETTGKLFSTSKTIKETFDEIAGEIMDIRAKFQTEIGEFSQNVVANLQNAQSATTHTMENAGHIAAEFRDSVIPMLSGINETVRGLSDAKDRIQPLADLMGKLESVLPSVADKSGEMTEELTHKISDMAEKINAMNAAAKKALVGIGDSTIALEKLSGESRQQMIDLVSDYTKAADTMRELVAGMRAARVSAPVVQNKVGVKAPSAISSVSVQDFIRQAGGIMERLHDLSVDLTRSIGAEIPDAVMEKYNGGDRAIFSKWFAKMIRSADKKRVKNIFKTDAVFRSQASQFVHGFARMLSGAERTDNKEMVAATLLKTDLGIMYQALKACL